MPGPDLGLRGDSVRTARLLIRNWQQSDAPLLIRAIDESLDHLRPWMPCALSEPSDLKAVEAQIAASRDLFLAGKDRGYGVFDSTATQVLGSVGLHPRADTGVLEIGYWLRADSTGKGFATEAVEAITKLAFLVFGAAKLEIHCDPKNVRSAMVPQRLRYRHEQTLIGNTTSPDGTSRDTMVWSLIADEYSATQHLPHKELNTAAQPPDKP
jgi:RimJ/RimL family protein N-acetyltransferase